jgi:DnaK suppressor protein
MSDKFKIKMREKLSALREALMATAETGDDASRVVELDQATVGRLSRMDAMQAQAMSQASVRRREVTLKMIDLALQRIEDHTFGICRSCIQPIARERLEFDPTASLCIDCAIEKEQAG